MPGHSGVRNSWGLQWGKAGNCFIPDDYLGLAAFGADYWAIFQNREIPS
jgi:C1A family cysteine protease